MHWRQMPMQSEKIARSAVCHALASDANAEREECMKCVCHALASGANAEGEDCMKCSVSCIGVRCQCRASRFVFQTQSRTVGSEIRFCGLSCQDGRSITPGSTSLCVCHALASNANAERAECTKCVCHALASDANAERELNRIARSAVCRALASDANAEREECKH